MFLSRDSARLGQRILNVSIHGGREGKGESEKATVEWEVVHEDWKCYGKKDAQVP